MRARTSRTTGCNSGSAFFHSATNLSYCSTARLTSPCACDLGKKRKINVRAPLYSLELLADREGMLQYLTGFDRESIDLLTQRLGEVVFLSPSF